MPRKQTTPADQPAPQERMKAEGGKLLWRTEVVHVGRLELWLTSGGLRLVVTAEEGAGTTVFRPE